jgi:hypothetical protein
MVNRAVSLDWMTWGVFGPNAFAAHWGGALRMNEQRADTEVRAPAALVLGPFRGMFVSAPIGGSGPSGLCPLGREMSVDGGLGGPVALGLIGWKPIVRAAGGRLVGGT